MKLLRVEKLTGDEKKYKAVFEHDGREKSTKFGATGYDDYTLTHDKEQRDRYRMRHRKDLYRGDSTSAGHLAWHLLWGDSTSLRENIASYRKRFNL